MAVVKRAARIPRQRIARGIGIPLRAVKLRLINIERYRTQGIAPRKAAIKSGSVTAGPAGMVRAVSSKRLRKLTAAAKARIMTKQTLKNSTNRAMLFMF
jgi:hypothetical protein